VRSIANVAETRDGSIKSAKSSRVRVRVRARSFGSLSRDLDRGSANHASARSSSLNPSREKARDLIKDSSIQLADYVPRFPLREKSAPSLPCANPARD